jgi:hypothetical protein
LDLYLSVLSHLIKTLFRLKIISLSMKLLFLAFAVGLSPVSLSLNSSPQKLRLTFCAASISSLCFPPLPGFGCALARSAGTRRASTGPGREQESGAIVSQNRSPHSFSHSLRWFLTFGCISLPLSSLLCSPNRDFITVEGFQDLVGEQFRISAYRIIDGVDTMIGAAQGEGVEGDVLGEVSSIAHAQHTRDLEITAMLKCRFSDASPHLLRACSAHNWSPNSL